MRKKSAAMMASAQERWNRLSGRGGRPGRRPDVLGNGTSGGAPACSKFTGPTFSPDGKVLSVNIHAPGITLAISGRGAGTRPDRYLA